MLKNYYNTILSQTFSPCGKYLFVGDFYGKISVFHLFKILNNDSTTENDDQKPKNVFTVQENVQINCMLTTENALIVGTVGEILGYSWKKIFTSADCKPLWKIEIPSSKDSSLEKPDINCLIPGQSKEYVHVGCGDNNVYTINLNSGEIVATLSGHTDYVHSIFRLGNELISGGEDGVVSIWDLRAKQRVNKIEPYKNDKIARPKLGKWIGAVSLNEDWLLCGGGPQLSLWHFRSLNPSTIFPLAEDAAIHVAQFHEDRILATGRTRHLYQLRYNGDIISEVVTSSATSYTAVHQMEPYKALCVAGSSAKIDVCSNFNYRDLVLST